MAGVMPSLSQPISLTLGGDYLRQMAAGDLAATEQMRKYREAQMESYADLGKSAMSNADDLSEVFGGAATAPLLENLLSADLWGTDASGNPLQPLAAGALSGEYTQQADKMRLAKAAASIAATRRGGGGRGSGGGGSGGAKMYVKTRDGKIIGVNSSDEFNALAGQGGRIYFPQPGETVTTYGKNGVNTFVIGGNAAPADVGGGVGGVGGVGAGGGDSDIAAILDGVDADDADAVVEALRSNGYSSAVVIGGEPYKDPETPVFAE